MKIMDGHNEYKGAWKYFEHLNKKMPQTVLNLHIDIDLVWIFNIKEFNQTIHPTKSLTFVLTTQSFEGGWIRFSHTPAATISF